MRTIYSIVHDLMSTIYSVFIVVVGANVQLPSGYQIGLFTKVTTSPGTRNPGPWTLDPEL